MQAVIMAGGRGTRLFSVTNDEIPKSMALLNSKPILEYQIDALKNNGITEIIIVIGHLGEKIQAYFGDGKRFGIHIKYIVENEPLGSAGSLYYLRSCVSDDFILIFGDIIFDISIHSMYNYHQDKGALVTLFTHPNAHPYDSDLVVADHKGEVIHFDSKHNKRNYYYNNCVNAGIYIFSPKIFLYVTEPVKLDLEKDLLFKLCDNGANVFSYSSTEYVKDVGTPDRLQKTQKDIERGLVARKNLSLPQKCVFFDRDGVLNRHIGLLYDAEQLELEKAVVEAIAEINSSEYLAIVVTNQPVVARGLCNIETVDGIHKKLQTLLGENHVYVDDILFCPHHPDKGYPKENPDYKVDCACRKPKTGMLETAAGKYNIDLVKSWLIGDTTTDIMTGKNAGVRTVLVKTGEAGADGKYRAEPDYVADNLLDAVRYVKENGNE